MDTCDGLETQNRHNVAPPAYRSEQRRSRGRGLDSRFQHCESTAHMLGDAKTLTHRNDLVYSGGEQRRSDSSPAGASRIMGLTGSPATKPTRAHSYVYARRVLLYADCSQVKILRVIPGELAHRLVSAAVAVRVCSGRVVRAIALTGRAGMEEPAPWSRVVREAVGEPVTAHVYSMRLLTADGVRTI